MPVTKQAKKKLRRDRRRSRQNEQTRRKLKTVLQATRKKPTVKAVAAAYQGLDKAVKFGIMHKNRAARLKSRLAKRLNQK